MAHRSHHRTRRTQIHYSSFDLSVNQKKWETINKKMVWENLMGWVGGVNARVCEVSYEFEYCRDALCCWRCDCCAALIGSLQLRTISNPATMLVEQATGASHDLCYVFIIFAMFAAARHNREKPWTLGISNGEKDLSFYICIQIL
jgi:hypothetical protein